MVLSETSHMNYILHISLKVLSPKGSVALRFKSGSDFHCLKTPGFPTSAFARQILSSLCCSSTWHHIFVRTQKCWTCTSGGPYQQRSLSSKKHDISNGLQKRTNSIPEKRGHEFRISCETSTLRAIPHYKCVGK